MMDLDFDALNKAVATLRTELGGSLVALDICDARTGLPLASYNTQPAASALFCQVTSQLTTTLDGAGYSPLKRYYMVELEGDRLVLVVNHDSRMLSCLLIDSNSASLGWIIGRALPQLIADVEAARH